MIKRTKLKAWLKLIKVERQRDPWGTPYKVTLDNIKRKNLICSLKVDEKYIRDGMSWQLAY